MSETVYGVNLPNSCFTFDRVYKNAAAAQNAITGFDEDGNPRDDGVLLGRYILVKYCDAAFDQDLRIHLNSIAAGGQREDREYSSAEEEYITNCIADLGISKDRHVYRKEYNGSNYVYKEIAQLNSTLSDESIKITGIQNQGDKTILSLDGNKILATTLNIQTVNKEDKSTYVQLTGVGGKVVSEFNANKFVADGMLENVTFNDATNELIFTWKIWSNKETNQYDTKTTVINLYDIIDPYQSGNGITVDSIPNEGPKINIKLDADTEDYLSVSEKGLKLSGIKEDFEQAQDDIDTIITALNNFADKEVVKQLPSFSFDWHNTTGNFEFGTKIAPKYDITFNPGLYKYPLPNGTATGCTATKYLVSFNNEEKTAASGTFTEIIVTPDKSNWTITAETAYSGSPTTPINDLGWEYKKGQIVSKADTKTFSIKGYRMGCFYGAVNIDNFNTENITSDIIRGLNKRNKAYTSETFNYTVPIGTTAILIACPSSKMGPAKVINTTVNAPMNDLCGENYITTLTVEGANGEAGEEYNVWMFKPAEPYASEANLAITLG